MYVGVDIGGTKVELCRFTEDYVVVARSKVSTDSLQPGGPFFWDSLVRLVSDFVVPSDREIGVAMKGIVHEQQVVYSSLMGGEVQAPLAAELSKLLGKPVRIDNDIRPLARAESRFGHARGIGAFSIVNLGTGLGIVHVEGEILKGYRSMAGQVDLLSGWIEQLGRFETFQNVISGAGVAALYRELAGAELAAEDVFAQSRAGNAKAKLVVEICLQSLAKFLSNLCYFSNPEIIIIHGSMRHSLRNVWTAFLLEFEKITDPFSRPREIVVSTLEGAACLGAALAW